MAYAITIPPHVVHETIDGEVIILNLKDGLYHTLNDPAGVIWRLLVEDNPVDDVADAIAGSAAISAEDARLMVGSLIAELTAEGLIVTSGVAPDWLASSTENGCANKSDGSWPSIDTYRDMRAALVLDPVHDVDESGWPTPKKTAPDPE